jgi:cell division protein FtsB
MDFRAAESSSDGTIYFPGALMRSSVARLGYALIVLVAASYALITLRGPQGVPALIQKQKEIRQLETQNADLAREIEFRRQRIQRLREDESEQELEIRQRLKLVRPGEKVFILQEPVPEKSPSPQP